MRLLLKYILPVLVALAFVGYGDGSSCADPAASDFEMALSEAAVSCDISESEPEPCLPRQITSSVNVVPHSNARRVDNSHRHGFEVIKSGKVINAGARYFVQNISIVISSSLTEPAHRLIRMGKLVI